MAPSYHTLPASIAYRSSSEGEVSSVASEIRAQLSNPGDVFSVLLLLGGETLGRALAQLCGSGFAPVAFSFGWVSYSIAALTAMVGENKLLPLTPDCQCKVINTKSGIVRDNSSWVIGRLMRDFEIRWRHEEVAAKVKDICDDKKKADGLKETPPRAGLVVGVYEPSNGAQETRMKRDLVFWIGVGTVILQIGLASVPWILHGNWGIFLITMIGTLLALITGVLPQWKSEKWACRRGTKDRPTHCYIITRGNGAQHALLILASDHGLNLEDLAAGQTNLNTSENNHTKMSLLVLSVLWILLLITSAGLKNHSWYLLAVGGSGMLNNIYTANRSRDPETQGVPLDYVGVVGNQKVMNALFELEDKFPGTGHCLVDVFFPNGEREDEKRRWEELKKSVKRRKEALDQVRPQSASVQAQGDGRLGERRADNQ